MTPEDAITQEVRALERLDLEGLRADWRRRYGAPPRLRSTDGGTRTTRQRHYS